jgi:hypothetical protein
LEGKPGISVVTVLTDGDLWINTNSIPAKAPPEAVQAFFRALSEIPGLSHIPEQATGWPSTWIKNTFVGQPEALERFKAAVVRLGDAVRG